MENRLRDQRKFERVALENHAFLTFVVNQEKRVIKMQVLGMQFYCHE